MSEPLSPAGSPLYRAPPPRSRPLWRTLLWIVLTILGAVLIAFLLTPHKTAGGRGGPGGPGGAAAGGGGGFGGPGGFGGGGGRRSAPTVVGVAVAEKGDIPIQLTELGTVTPEANVVVRTRIAGTLMKVNFREGQMVRAGQELAEVDQRPYVVALQLAQAQQLRDQATLANAQLDLQRYKTLLSQDSISSQQVDTQAATVKSDEATVKSDQANVASARLNVVYCHITAPVAGRVGLRAVDAGNYVSTGDANGVVTITKLDPIDVLFALSEDSVPQVSSRMNGGAVLPATALDRTGATALAEGVLATLDNQIDTSTGTVKAKARFSNATGALFPNQFVNVQLTVDTLKDAVVVPTQAVRHGSKGDYVFIIQPDQTAKMTMVKVGPGLGERVSIASGVAVGDRLVTDGGDRLNDGGRVILPGQIPPNMANFGARKQNTGFFGWLKGLFGGKTTAAQDQGAGGAAAGGAGGSGAGGGGQGGGRGGAGRMQGMLSSLNLTPDQKAKTDAIFADMRQKMASAGDDPDARRTIMRDSLAKIDAVLTPDQKAKLDEQRAEARAAGGFGGPGGGGGGGGAPAGGSESSAPPTASSSPASSAAPVAGAPREDRGAGLGGGSSTPGAGIAGRRPGGGFGGPGGPDPLGLDADQKAKQQAIFADARQKAEAASDPDARRAIMQGARAKFEAILRPDQKAKLAAMRAQGGFGGGGRGGQGGGSGGGSGGGAPGGGGGQ